MLQRRTMLKTADNTGIKKMMVFHIYQGSKRKFARVGDVVRCTVKDADSNAMFKKSSQVICVIVRTKKEIGRKDGSYIRFDENAAVVIGGINDKNPKGTRIFGPVAREIKDLGYSKIISMAAEVL